MAIESQDTYLEMETGSGGAVTITAMTLANPTMLTAVAHGLSNGDVVTAANFAGTDAGDINGNSYVVQFVTDDTFAIDLDSTDLTITDNTDAATMTPKALTEIGEVVDGSREDPGANEIDVTHLRSTAKEFLMGLEDSGTYTLNVNWLFDDAGQEAVRAAKTSRDVKSFKVTYPDASTMTFDAYVKSFTGPGAAVDGKLTGSITLRITGPIVFA